MADADKTQTKPAEQQAAAGDDASAEDDTAAGQTAGKEPAQNDDDDFTVSDEDRAFYNDILGALEARSPGDKEKHREKIRRMMEDKVTAKKITNERLLEDAAKLSGVDAAAIKAMKISPTELAGYTKVARQLGEKSKQRDEPQTTAPAKKAATQPSEKTSQQQQAKPSAGKGKGPAPPAEEDELDKIMNSVKNNMVANKPPQLFGRREGVTGI